MIKPCPFCGDDAEYCDEYDKQGTLFHFIFCKYCESSSGKYETKEMAIQRWNKRTKDTK